MRIKIGDVFAIPLGNGEFAFGQIVANGSSKCYVIYDYKSNDFPDLSLLIRQKIIFLTYTEDLYIRNGNWKVLGNINPPSNIIFPEYRVETLNGTVVIDHTGKKLRFATDKEKTILSTHKSVSPMILEKSVKARFGTGESYPYAETLLYKE